jgi:hypothetical protein
MNFDGNTLRNYRNNVIDDSVSEHLLKETIAWISANLNPEDVFDYCDLHCWATENGFDK